MDKKIKKFDFFGHPVQLNYKNEGVTHNTVCGGIISIFIMLLMINLVVVKTKIMLFKENDEFG